MVGLSDVLLKHKTSATHLPSEATNAMITDIRVGHRDGITRMVFDLSRSISYNVFLISDPYRMVIDMPEVGWQLPPKPLPNSLGVLEKMRYGLFQPGVSRVVVDLNQPALVQKTFLRPSSGSNSSSIVIDLVGVTKSEFIRNQKKNPPTISRPNAAVLFKKGKNPPHFSGLMSNEAPLGPSVAIAGKGDTVYSLAKRYRVSANSIISANGLVAPYVLEPGQRIIILRSRTVVVLSGDSLAVIASRHNVDVFALARLNNLRPPYTIYVGQRLILPNEGQAISNPASPPKLILSDIQLCRVALAMRGDVWVWEERIEWLPSVKEAKRRGLNLERCGELTNRKVKPDISIAKIHPPISINPPTNSKVLLSPAPTKDTTPPTIDIASAITVDTDNPTVKGQVNDDEQVAQVTVEGRAVDLSPNGIFSFTRYVPASGTTVTIEAIDEWGNKSTKTVHLTRTITDTSDQLTFTNLDPTKIDGRDNKNAVALIIGVADYTRAPAAVYADSDANVFSDYARRAFGIPRSSIKVLTNGNASLTDLKLNVKQWLRGRIEEGKTDVYVFYAGHGLASSDGEDLYLLPHDGVPSLLEDTSLQRNELFDVIAAANPKSATIFLDTCYSGLSRGDETLLASARPILITAKHQAAPEGFTVFSAASGLQISSGLDEAKHGLFSYYLMKGLEGPADANGDRVITAGELHDYVRGNVKRQAIRLGREQMPELQGDTERVLVRW